MRRPMEAPVAPGNLIAIFGSNLSASAGGASVPFPSKVLDTAVLLDGQNIPLYYASTGQVNAMIPYGLPTNASHQLVLQKGTGLSVPAECAGRGGPSWSINPGFQRVRPGTHL